MAAVVSGMAASIRAATESETFDLAGHSAANIEHTMTDAFTESFSIDEMVRVTLVVGGGKQSRQKYDEKAMQAVTSALRKLNFQEDRGASCVWECAGTFKTQHDTGKNVFTVVVFPYVRDDQGGDEPEGGGGGVTQQYPTAFPLSEGSPEHTVLVASEETFAKTIPSMCPSWTEKKLCSEILKAGLETIGELDSKLMTGTPLTNDEQEFYDEVGGSAAADAKAEFLRKAIHQQVETGSITSAELDKLLSQVSERVDALDDEIDVALNKTQEKKAAKLQVQREKAIARKAMIEGRTPQVPHRLKHEAKIMALRKKLQPLLKLEASSKGRLISMKDTKELASKDDVLEEIMELEFASQGWFENDDAFDIRLEISRKKKVPGATVVKAKAGGAGKKPGTGSRSKNAAPSWVTPGGLAAKQSALGKKAANKSKTKGGGGVFAAMMMDSDSD